MLEARCVISHDIFHPIDEGDLGAVAMVALMKAGDLAEVGGWPASGSAAFEVARQSGSVVGEVGNSSTPCVVGVVNVIKLDYYGGLFKVAVGNVTRWVVAGDKATH